MLASIAFTMFLATAVWTDITSGRIPNRLTLAAAILGVTLSVAPGGIGPGEASRGLAIGFLALLPLYGFRAIGAGDVKLMAAAGTFLGMAGTLTALVYALALGGALTLGYAAKKRALARLFGNLRLFVQGSAARIARGGVPTVDDMPLSRVRVPYALAIAGGVLLQLLTRYFSGAGA